MTCEGLDRFALYLRPDPSALECVDPHALQAATTAQARWGGLHCTLCSFAAKADSPGAGPRHRSSLRRAIADVAAAVAKLRLASTAAGAAGGWHFSSGRYPALTLYEFTTCSAGSPSKYGVALPPVDPVVLAICAEISCAGLHGARRPEQLHITLGTLQASAAEAVLEALQNCESWHLAIAKCAANEMNLRTSRFSEIVHLA